MEVTSGYMEIVEKKTSFENPLHRSENGVGNSKIAKKPMNNNEEKRGVEKCHVACHQMDETNTRAEWVVDFGAGDHRNKTGVVLGELAIQRADLMGLQKVLEQAAHSGTHRVHITTDSKYLDMVQRFRPKWKSLGWKSVNGAELLNRKQIVLVDTLSEKLESVRIELVPGPRYTPNNSGGFC